MQKIIAHITDTHFGDPTALSRGINPEENLQAILKDAALHNVDSIVHTGDIGSTENYGKIFASRSKKWPDFKLTLGNHDSFQDVIKYYSNYVTAEKNALYYAYEEASFKHIFLDSSSSYIDNLQFEWLEQELTGNMPLLIFIHHPILGFKTGMDKEYPLKNREQIEQLLQKYTNKVLIFCGHYHMPDARRNKNITQYITPAVSFQVKKESDSIEITKWPYGYRLINIKDGEIKTTLFLNNGKGFIQQAEQIITG